MITKKGAAEGSTFFVLGTICQILADRSHHGTIFGMIRRLLRFLYRLLLIISGLGILALILPRMITGLYARSRLVPQDQVESPPVAIVFGAGLWRDGTPTPVLRDRVATAADLYFAGKVKKLLMSGDNRFVEYNEPGAMSAYAVSLGVPLEAIVMDFAGRRTYDTCFRAREIFGVQEAVLVTQEYHLPRAIYTCNMLDVDAVGTPADQRVYRRGSLAFWNTRELLATLIAFWDLHVSHPLPVLGEPEPIFEVSPTGAY